MKKTTNDQSYEVIVRRKVQEIYLAYAGSRRLAEIVQASDKFCDEHQKEIGGVKISKQYWQQISAGKAALRPTVQKIVIIQNVLGVPIDELSAAYCIQPLQIDVKVPSSVDLKIATNNVSSALRHLDVVFDALSRVREG